MFGWRKMVFKGGPSYPFMPGTVFDRKLAIVTGTARGIGRAIAHGTRSAIERNERLAIIGNFAECNTCSRSKSGWRVVLRRCCNAGAPM
jgi:hypothetical protein